MSTIENDSTVTPAVPPSTYAEAAQERVRELRRWRDQIPRFAIPATTDATQRLTSAARVSAQFIELTNMAVANHMELVRGGAVAPGEVRDLVAYSDAFGPLADELEALAKFVRYSTTAARNAAGHEALTTYALATRLSKRAATAFLAPHVADMRRALGHGRRLTPEEAAQKAAVRAEKAAQRAAQRAARRTAAQPEAPAKPQA